jgi:hypothetical protein
MNRSKIYRLIAAVVLGLTALFWMFKGIVDLVGGVRGGIQNTILAITLFVLVLISWKWLLWGGIITAFSAVILAMYFFLLPTYIQTITPHLLLMCAPMVISGLLFIEADWASKKRN